MGQELDRLEKQGVIKKVNSSDWAAPIVTVPKPEGKIHLCGDYKVTVNQALTVDQYPMPKPEELFATLANGHKFTKLDLQQAYLQMELKQLQQKKNHDKHSKLRTFEEGQSVLARGYLSSKKWMSGEIVSVLGPAIFKVKLTNGNVITRHIDQIQDLQFADHKQQEQFEFFTSEIDTPEVLEAPPNNSPPIRKTYPQRDRRPVERHVWSNLSRKKCGNKMLCYHNMD